VYYFDERGFSVSLYYPHSPPGIVTQAIHNMYYQNSVLYIASASFILKHLNYMHTIFILTYTLIHL